MRVALIFTSNPWQESVTTMPNYSMPVNYFWAAPHMAEYNNYKEEKKVTSCTHLSPLYWFILKLLMFWLQKDFCQDISGIKWHDAEKKKDCDCNDRSQLCWGSCCICDYGQTSNKTVTHNAICLYLSTVPLYAWYALRNVFVTEM